MIRYLLTGLLLMLSLAVNAAEISIAEIFEYKEVQAMLDDNERYQDLIDKPMLTHSESVELRFIVDQTTTEWRRRFIGFNGTRTMEYKRIDLVRRE